MIRPARFRSITARLTEFTGPSGGAACGRPASARHHNHSETSHPSRPASTLHFDLIGADA